MVEQQPILTLYNYAVSEYILIISEYKLTNFVSPVPFNIWTE